MRNDSQGSRPLTLHPVPAANEVLSFSVGDYAWTKPPVAGEEPKLARVEDAHPTLGGLFVVRLRKRAHWSVPGIARLDRALTPGEVAHNRRLGLIEQPGQPPARAARACEARGEDCDGEAWSVARFCRTCLGTMPPTALRTSELMLLTSWLLQTMRWRQHAAVLEHRAELLAKEAKPTPFDAGLEDVVEAERKLLRRIGEVRL